MFTPHRQTLGAYFNSGKEIVVVGVVADRKRPVEFILDDNNLPTRPKNEISPQEAGMRFMPVIKINREFLTMPIGRLNWATVITEVKGINGFESIEEDHVIIQENMVRFMPGKYVTIFGTVIMYKDDSKEDGFDYGISLRGYK